MRYRAFLCTNTFYVKHVLPAVVVDARGLRLGRSCRDRFARKLLSQGDMSRPLVLGTGNASFKCTGKGEMAVPTTDLDKAVVRQLLRMKSQRKILRLFIDEFRTTVCDSETLKPTQGKQVNKWERDEEGNVVINGRSTSTTGSRARGNSAGEPPTRTLSLGHTNHSNATALT